MEEGTDCGDRGRKNTEKEKDWGIPGRKEAEESPGCGGPEGKETKARKNQEAREEAEPYWEWFCSIPGLYRTQQEVLLRCFGNPRAVWEATEQEIGLLDKRGCAWVGKVSQYQKKSPPWQTVHSRREKGIQFISHVHACYPKRLEHLKNKPYGLFFRGELPREEAKAVAVVGARACTHYGRRMAELIGEQTAGAGGVVISGAAYGVDGAAQWAALEKGGKSFGVMGCGVDIFYPPSNARLFERLEYQGGILSEFPPGTPPMRSHFPMRNRIISGLADVVVVVEARKKSGSLITADFAAEQGRYVMAVPGRTDDDLSQGCNDLIAQGAGVILSAASFGESVFPEVYRRGKEFSENLALAPAEKLVYSSLGLHSKSIWELVECTSLSLAELSTSLWSLEQQGLIKEMESNYYIKMR